jgi:hypothetical protein
LQSPSNGNLFSRVPEEEEEVSKMQTAEKLPLEAK